MTTPTDLRDQMAMAADDDWTECWNCSGEGELEDCFEDTCVCVDPPCCTSRCDVCRGKGGWPTPEPADALLAQRARTTEGEGS